MTELYLHQYVDRTTKEHLVRVSINGEEINCVTALKLKQKGSITRVTLSFDTDNIKCSNLLISDIAAGYIDGKLDNFG